MKQSDINDLVKQNRLSAFNEVMFRLAGQAAEERRIYGKADTGLIDAIIIVNTLIQEETPHA